MRFANIVASVIGMVFSGVAFIMTLSFKKFKNVPVGPEFFPRWLAIGLFFCSVALLIQSAMNRKDKKPAPPISPFNKDIQRMLCGLAVVVVSAVLWSFLGFLIVTPFTLFALMFVLGKRNWKIMILLSIIITALIYLAFKYLLGIDMPMGLFE